VAIRLGGDEFLLALHDCPEDEAGLLLQRIEKRMAEIPAREAKPFPLTASFGVATYDPLRHGKVDDLVAEADSRMYAAKQAKKSACQASGTGR
jgi:diguanylate cyclase (GGDEF)-like protein